MSASSHLERRGAVYYYRRRLPRALSDRIGQRFLILSLKTREPMAARYIAAQLDAVFAKMTLETSDFWISKAQLQDFFRHAYRVHEEIVRRSHAKSLAAGWLSQGRPDFVHLVEGWAWRLIAQQGVAASLRPEDMEAMREGGMPEDLFAEVETVLAFHCRPDRIAEQRENVAKVLVEVGAIPNETNVDRALSAFARAKSEANFRNRPDADELDVDALVAETQAQTHSIAWTPPGFRFSDGYRSDDVRVLPAAPAVLSERHPASAEALRPAQPSTVDVDRLARALPRRDLVVPATASVEARAIERDFSVSAIAEKLILESEQDKLADQKTLRQIRMITDLLGRFLTEERNVTSLAQLVPEDVEAFDTLLRNMGKNYGKAQADKTRTIKDLRQRWAKLPQGERGLEAKTRNKHYAHLNALLARARKAGASIDRELTFSAFRVKLKGRARTQRAIPSAGVFEQIFDQPIYTGCASWQLPFEPGPHVYHRAAYFGPLLAHYHGLRREEFCGLMIADVAVDAPIPFIQVQPNEQRTLKTAQSERMLALHPELIRLGLLDYAATLEAIGHTHLFPELVSPSSNSPLGDRYYDEWKPGLTKLGFTPHAQRHFFNNALKQKMVGSELRADLMGHGGKGETEERYADAIGLAQQLELIAHVPVNSGHIDPRPIKLIDWVARREIAPWSRAAVAERREAAAASRRAKLKPRRPL